MMHNRNIKKIIDAFEKQDILDEFLSFEMYMDGNASYHIHTEDGLLHEIIIETPAPLLREMKLLEMLDEPCYMIMYRIMNHSSNCVLIAQYKCMEMDFCWN